MYIKTLSLQNFRNYKNLTVHLNSGLNIFVGNNAQGKTNLLEAIYILSLSKSYRTGREIELINHDENQTSIQARIKKMANLDLTVIVGKDTPKRLLVNNKGTTSNKFMGHLNSVLFTPDSLQLVKGSPGERRRFLDIQICQIDPVYRETLLKYQRVVRQRNSLLKSAIEQRSLLNQLPSWDEQLLSLGAKIMFTRQDIVETLQYHSKVSHGKISNEVEELTVIYEPFFAKAQKGKKYTLKEIENRFRQLLQEKRQEEIRRAHTLLGPQRDDLVFTINDLDLRTYGSQGQQRTAVLSYILAELELMHQETNEYPIVLLDDVMSELDKTRRNDLVSILNDKAQIIVTTTDLSNFTQEIIEKASLFNISGGKIIQ